MKKCSSFFLYKSWYVKGVRCVIDLFDENQNFLDFVELKRNFNIQINNLTLMQVRQAVLSELGKYSFIRNDVFILLYRLLL